MSDLCASIQDDLKAYCDGELPFWRRIAVRRHLTGCAACREEVHAMQMLHEGLRAGDSPEIALSPALRARILAQVADIPPLPAPNRTYRLLQYGLAASLVANFAFLLFMGQRGTDTLTPRSTSVQTPVQAPAAVPLPRTTASIERETRSHPMMASPQSSRAAAQKSLEKREQQLIVRPEPTPRSRAAVNIPSATAGGPTAHAVAPRLARAVPAESDNASHILAQATNGVGSAAKSMTTEAAPNTAPAPKPENDTLEQAQSEPAPQSRAARRSFAAAAPAPAPPSAAMSAPLLPAPAPAPTAPPAPAPPQAKTVPNTTMAVRGFAAGGFGGGRPGGTDGTRDKPTALDPWPVLSSPAAAADRTAQSVDADWLVDEKGQTSDIHFTTTGNPAVDDSIRDAIRHNRYLPALKNGKPVSARMSHTFVVDL